MIIFGADKLPEIGSAFGRGIKNIKQSYEGRMQMKRVLSIKRRSRLWCLNLLLKRE